MAKLNPHVVVLGGGFGGLEACRTLRNAPVNITLIDRRNHHLFQPLLYQVATAGLSGPHISAPLRRILRDQKNVSVLLEEAASIDTRSRKVILAHGEVFYDYLILATGATHSYFGNDHWAPFAPGLKTLKDAITIRKRILLAFERAERVTVRKKRETNLTFVIIGGGPTGVELAGALAEISRHTLKNEFRNINPRDARIILLEGSPRILGSFPADLSAQAETQLKAMGVEIRTNALVSHIDASGVQLGEERIDAETVLWAAGVKGSPVAATLGVPLDRAGRVRVQPDLTIPRNPWVYVIGDLASLECDGLPVPGVAPAALQQGRHAGLNILRSLKDQDLKPFKYVDKGSLATIGRSAAIAKWGNLKLSGFLAWLAWLLIHVYFLIGFRNRMVVLFEWAWAYFSYQRSARIIPDSEQNEDTSTKPES